MSLNEDLFDKREFVGRAYELQRIKSFLDQNKSGFLHVRGRRRIGKSWFLKKVATQYPGCFYFQGLDDASGRSQMASFAKRWDAFAGDRILGKIKQSELTWDSIFSEIHRHVKIKRSPVVLLLDEIQWIAKRRSGFLSHLKEAWISWESSKLIKVVVSGSSCRFFQDEKGPETKILRGLRTFSDIHLGPFTLKGLKKYFFKKWSHEEICLVYMITGGIPYYIRALDPKKSLIKSVNEAFFTQKSFFFNEVDEILRLEFNKSSINGIKKILSQLDQDGKTLSNICRGKGITLNEKTVRETLGKLVDYNIVFEKKRDGENPKATKAGVKYIMKDCFLNFYFQVLKKHEAKIKSNKSKNIFGHMVSSRGYYIENFSGKAFELLIQLVLEECQKTSYTNGIIKKLNLEDFDFEVGYYWQQGETEVDRVVLAHQARQATIVEAKWASEKAKAKAVEQVLEKAYTPPRRYRLEYCLVLSGGWTKALEAQAQQEDVLLMGLDDLF